MKLQSVKMVLLVAAILASPVLTFAGGQPNHVYTPPKYEAQDRASIAQNVNQGKGAGLTRNDAVLRGNAYRSETGEDAGTLNAKTSAGGANWNDSGFHK